jgi:hypothetical protein
MVGHDPDRRRLLNAGVTLATVGLAGCMAGEPTPTPTPTEPQGCDDTTASMRVDDPAASGGSTTGDPGLTVDRARLVESVIADYDVFNRVERPEGENDGRGAQILELLITVDPDADLSELGSELVVDGTVHDAATLTPTYYDPLVESDAVALSVPVPPASEATVQFTRGPVITEEVVGTWPVPSELVARFDSAPAFAVGHAEMVPCESPTLGLVVENTGDRDGMFRGLAFPPGTDQRGTTISFGVPEGDTVRRRVAVGGFDDGRGLELDGWSADTRAFHYI